MKVLFISNQPSPYRVSFFNELSKYCELTVVFEVRDAKNRDVKWKCDESMDFRCIFLNAIARNAASGFCPNVVRYIRTYRNDIIILGNYSTPTGLLSTLYMKLHHISYILNADGGFVSKESVLKSRVKRYFIGSADYWLSSGVVCSRYWVHYGADAAKIFHYPFAADRKIANEDVIDIDSKRLLREKLGIREKKMILFVGQFIFRKGLDILLGACWNLCETAVVMVGGSDVKSFLPEDRNELPKHFYIEGFKEKTALREYYQAADIFVFPTREDIWGLVINEAMTYGLPVVTTDRCGAGLELVKNGENGYLVPVDDVEKLRESIEHLLDDDDLRRHMSDANRKKMENYTIGNMAYRHYEVLQDIQKKGH